MKNLTVINHPLVDHKVAILRDENTPSSQFKRVVDEITTLMTYEVTKDLATQKQEIKTPVAMATCNVLSGKSLVIVPILRAGLGMVDGMRDLMPSAKIGHIGLKRDEVTKEPIEYYFNMPENMDQRDVLIVDPMLATGGSAAEAIRMVKETGTKNIKLVCLVGCPEGVKLINEQHPDVQIYLAALDERLNEKAYITPGLGDAGDRLFGTK